MTVAREVIPQPGDRWLLRDGGRCYAIPAALGRRLRDGETLPDLDAALAGGTARPRLPGGRTVWLRLPLLPAPLVAEAARALAGLTAWRGLALLAATGAAGYAAALALGPPSGGAPHWPLLVSLVLAAGLIHELGHAAALARGGGRPGGVGLGLLLIFPVLWCDVTAVSLLPRPSRARVDVAGLAWHLTAGGALALGGAVLSSTPLTLASWGVLAAAAWSLLPFLRTDGYWLLCDLLGLQALEEPAPTGSSRWLRAALIGWRLGHFGFLGFVAMVLAGRARWLVEQAWTWPTAARAGVLVVAVGIAVMVGSGLVRRGVALGRGVWKDMRGGQTGT